MRWIDLAFIKSYKSAFGAYSFLMLLLFHPYVSGQVIAPHRYGVEVAAVKENREAAQIENRKFSDHTNSYLPEISEHFNGARSSWLTLWTNKNELGRPVCHISGLGPAYAPAWLIGKITHNPLLFLTTISLFTCYFAGVFLILYCREISLSPLAGLMAGTSLAASPLIMYWLTFPMFPAIWCWSAGALWAVSRLANKPDLLGWGALAFSGYSLLMAAYPQPVVFHAYLLGGYGLLLAYRKHQVHRHEALLFVLMAVSALATGAALAFPVYRDLAVIAAESARVSTDPSFFTAVLPEITGLVEAVRFFVLSTMPEFFGNPIDPAFPFPYDGLSIPLVSVFFAVVGFFSAFKRTWGWSLAIGIFCLFAFVHPLYILGVRFLGFNLSRSTPLGSIMLPLTVMMAHGVDDMVQRIEPDKIRRLTIVSTVAVLLVMAVGLGYGLAHSLSIRWSVVLLMLMSAGMLAAQFQRTRPWLMISALIVVLASTSFPLMLRQDPAQIATTSPLVKSVRMNLPEGSRFAVAAPGISALPPNLNAGLELPSIHSYNSLSSRCYHTLIRALGGKMKTYGRRNSAIAPDYSGAMFWMSNIGLVLSPTPLAHENLKDLGAVSGIHLSKVISHMGDSIQVTPPRLDMSARKLKIADPRLLPNHNPIKLQDKGDILEFEVAQGAQSVLILSQKFHRDWQAQILAGDGWKSAVTSKVNGVFLGVLIPAGVQRVRVEFKPFSRFAWIAHIFWLLMLTFIGITTWHRSR